MLRVRTPARRAVIFDDLPCIYLAATYLRVLRRGLVRAARNFDGLGRRDRDHGVGRAILGQNVGASEDEVFWRTFLLGLRQ